MFKSIPKDRTFPDIEQDVLTFWDTQEIFKKSLEQTKDGKPFVFYDGPPFATGLPHYGHLLAGTLKDIIPRYWTMRGHYVERRFGWDCHGLPVENEIEKQLKISGKQQIEEIGVATFNEACRSIVLRYTSEWKKTVKRMGRWVDFKDDYKTMQPSYMESIWWVFKQLWDKELIYNGFRVQPYCPRCSTPLSNFETNQGYADVQDPSITVHMPLLDRPNTSLLVWTTTPWTLPSNVAIAVGADIEYIEIKDGDHTYILAESRLSSYYKKTEDIEILNRYKGSALVGLYYKPLFTYFADRCDTYFKIVHADFVSTENGTGLVHIAPAFGEDDYTIGQEHNWPIVCPVDEEGKYTDEVPEYQGVEVKAADKRIIKRLKDEGSLIHQGTIQHSYPHCYRCDSPLIYKAISTWFCNIEPLKEKMLKNNNQVHWVPEHLQHGRFGKWLEGARDWNLSRNRYWGTPIPVWTCEQGHHTCIGSTSELEKLTGQKITDLHKHFIDDLTFPCPQCGTPTTRITEVLDCWFESGAMPYAQHHYPFENKEKVDATFPADFVAEGLDQTRGWFYTLLVISSALFDKPAFKNVIVNGIILAEDGKKMSKRLKNYPAPELMLNKYGADAIRLFMINSAAVRAETLCFTEQGIVEILRSVIIPLWNSYQFFITYANEDIRKAQLSWRPEHPYRTSVNELDRWIMSDLQTLTAKVRTEMDAYHLDRVVPALVGFVDNLTNWYIRRSRERFWRAEDDTDKNDAYATLYQVLITFCKLLAPSLPFLPEAIYRSLISFSTEDAPESVHLCPYPEVITEQIDTLLERKMALIRRVVFMGRSLRSSHRIKNRQPLPQLSIITRDTEVKNAMDGMQILIADELNIKDIIFAQNEDELVTLSAKPNFKVLGKRMGKRMKEASAIIATFSTETIHSLEQGATEMVAEVAVAIEDITVVRTPREGMVLETFESLTVVLDTTVTPELRKEGIANDLINRIQNLRKESGFNISDHIALTFLEGADPHLQEVLCNSHKSFIKDAVLAESIDPATSLKQPVSLDIDGKNIEIEIRQI